MEGPYTGEAELAAGVSWWEMSGPAILGAGPEARGGVEGKPEAKEVFLKPGTGSELRVKKEGTA